MTKTTASGIVLGSAVRAGLPQPRRHGWRRAALATLCALICAQAAADTPSGYAEFIIPFDEDVFAFVTQPVSATVIGPNDTTFTLISVTAWSDTVTIYYDHWENGYGYDPNDPDGLGTDEKYTLNASQTLNFTSLTVPRPRTGADGNTYVGAAGNCNAQPTPGPALLRRTPNYCYDGRDRIITVGGAATVTRGGYLNTPGMGKLAAIGEEVFPLAPQLIKYILPFGENAARNDYQQVLAVVQATEDDTVIQIDFNGDGVFDAFNTENGYRTTRADPVDATTLTLQRGQAYVVDRNSDGVAGGTLLGQGTVILGTKTLQVEYFYGRTASNYDSRAVSAFPRGFWAKDYYAPADGGNAAVCGGGVCNTDLLLYNPNSGTITIDWATTAGSGSFTMAANETAFLQAKTGSYVPNGSGVYVRGSATFWGTSDIDTNRNDWDWGYSLVPTYLLSRDQTVAWAPGNSPVQACNTANARGNGLFVTPVLDNTIIFVDANADGTPDTNASIEVLRGQTVVTPTSSGYRANRLESLYITGSNTGTTAGSPCDLTGARIYATGPFSMAYGENPDKTSAGGGLDLGYTVLPSPGNWMDLVLTVAKSTSPVLVSTVAGATTVTFTLVVQSHIFNVDSVNVVDTLPANWTFDPNSAVITLPDLTQISGAAANPTVTLPTLTWGPGLLGSLLPNQQITITFNARTTAAFPNGALTRNDVAAVGTRTVGGVTQTFRASDFAFNAFTDGSLGMQLTKASSVPEPTPVSPGDTLTYTATVTNPAGTTTTLTGVTVYDPLPAGVSYVPGSGSVTCQRSRNVRDEFAAVAYTGNNGSDNWATNWVETDAYGTFANGAGGAGGAAGGYVAVTGGVLRFTYLLSTVRDNFDTNGSFAGNNGSNAWASNWTEENDDASASGGDIQIANNRIEFRDTTDGGEAIRRSATVTNATSITVQLDWDAFGGLDANDDLIVEWSLNGTTWNLLRTLDGGVADGTYSNTIAWTPTDTTFILRFRAEDAIEGGEQARIDNVQVSFDVPANAVGAQVVRTADLTGVATPALTLTTTSAGLAAGDTVVLEAATSAAGPFTVLATSTGNVGAGAFAPAGPYDLTPYASATTAIRLRVTGGYNATTKVLNVDNVDIAYVRPSTFASGAPPELVPSSAGCRIAPNSSMTVTFNVTVDNPFPTGQRDIVNVVTAGASQIPVPLTATARNIVIVPGGLTGSVGDRVWLDANANGIFDAGETGIGGVELTLKDQFGTPLQVITTDSQGRYTFIDVAPGNGYFVEITGGLPAGLTQTTDTVGDAFNINGLFTGNNGTLDWLTNWTETNDDGSATTGDIRIANNRIEFRDTVGTVVANESIQRSVTVTGATGIEVQYAWAGTGLVAGSDQVVVEYSTNGTTWTTLRTINADAATTFTDSLPWVPTNNTFFLRYRNQDVLETNKLASIDNVQVRFPQSLRTANFNLAPGQDYVQADLGYRAADNTAAIGDLVWVDANADLVRNPGEVGLAGITVQLYEDTNGDGLPDGPPVATTVSGPGGAYLFTGIPANGVRDWVVTMNTGQAPLAGYTATTNTLFSYANLPSGAVRVDADFGFTNPAATFTITDGVWLDNGLPSGTPDNGVQDGAEAGIAGVTVDLLDSAGNTIATAITGSDGKFQFTGVPGGQNYRWRITDIGGVLADHYGTTPSALSGGFQMTGNLTGNLDFTSPSNVRHFGYNQTRSIGDTVWNDLDNNQARDAGEPGLGGVTLLLYRNDGDGLFEPGGDDGSPIATQVTDPNGQYLFAGLAAGTYWVSIDNTQSALTGYSLTTTDGSPVAGHQLLVTPPLTGSANRLDVDFGYRAATPFAISGRFFSDLNRNGVDNSDPGFAGVTVDLRNSAGLVVGTTTTDSTGAYSFPGLPPGTYTVRVTDTSGVLTGYETTFERTEGGLAAPYNGQETVTLGPGVTNVNFGYYRGPSQPTRAVIASFVARDIAGAVALEWSTASEAGTVGFYVRRWDERLGQYVDLHERLLPALVGVPQGGVYRYIDTQAVPSQPYRYALVEVEASGARLGYGPFDVDTRRTLDDPASEAALDDQVLRQEGYSRTPRSEDPQARQARAEAVARDQARVASRRGAQTAQAAKIGVSESAIHYVAMTELQAQAGVAAPQSLASLTNRGRPVAYTRWADQGILFYGRGTQSAVERDNVYRFSSDSEGVLMQTRTNPDVPPPTGSEAFIRRLHVEQDAIAATGVFNDPDGDYWVWDYVYAGYGAKSFTFRTDGATRSDTGSVTIRLKGGTETPADPDHHATFTLNGSFIGEAYWNGTEALQTTLAFDASLLIDGENVLTIDGLSDTGAPYSLFYVDAFDVLYTSFYRAHGNKFEGPASGHAAVLVSGFTRPDVAVFDVTVPARPVIVQAPVTPTSDGTYGVVLASTDKQAVYYAVTPDAVAQPTRILPDTPSTLRQPDNEGEYLVVTTEALRETAQGLADHRSELRSQVVDIEDVYDEFNYGNASPYALRAFLAYARTQWQVPPRYVVLAGDGTYDYKDFLGFGGNAIPPMMASTPSGLFPSDPWFVAAQKLAQPEPAIGRLPVTTTDELTQVIGKIQAREAALSEPWVRSGLLAADDVDAGGDFPLSSEGVAAWLPADLPLTRAYIATAGTAQARSVLLAGINQGTGVVSYFGHAGYDRFADEGLLTNADAPALTNTDRPTIMTAITCLAGNAALPGYPALGELLVRAPGGAVALWAPSGMSENDLADPLAQRFYAALFGGRSERIGEAVAAARRGYRQDGLPSYMLSIYNLLGDPALRVR
jgi:uncharacterized repeat protein (TIGR01451 family)